MDEEKTPQSKVPLKGQSRGGARFPKQPLTEALEWSGKLVSKTHVGPQPESTILPAVFGSNSTTAQVKASTLRQFGLLEGEKSAYSATELARSLKSVPEDEREPLLRKAALLPPVFKGLFDTFHGDAVTRAKIRYRATALKVHPDSADACVENYVTTAALAGLAVVRGDQVEHISAQSISDDAPSVEADTEPEKSNPEESPLSRDESSSASDDELPAPQHPSSPSSGNRPGVIFNVNVSLDSSLDSEKLSKQLELLKRFGVI